MIPLRTGPGVVIEVVLCFTALMLGHVAYVGWLRRGFRKKGWLKYEVIGCCLIAMGLCTGSSANFLVSSAWYLLLSGAGTLLFMGGYMTIHLSHLWLFQGPFKTRGWLRYELVGCGISAMGLFLLLINDPLKWELEINRVYGLMLLGFISLLVGAALVMVGDRKARGTTRRGSALKVQNNTGKTMEKCSLCAGDLYRAGQSHTVGGHSFCGECYSTIEEARKRQSNS